MGRIDELKSFHLAQVRLWLEEGKVILGLLRELDAEDEIRKALDELRLAVTGNVSGPIPARLMTADAVREVLVRASAAGHEELTAGEVEAALSGVDVRSRLTGKRLPEGSLWRAIASTLGCNAEMFVVKKAGKRLQRNDKVSLAPAARQTKRGG